MTFTFLHCADLHLGSPMAGLALKDEDIARRFAAASRNAFRKLIDHAIGEKVAFALIAGDLYDGDWPDNSVGLFFNQQASRLARADIPVYLVKGNHDAESVVTRTIPLPPEIVAFSSRRPETHEIAAVRVALHGRSFAERAATENWALDYPRAKPGWFNIGLLHTSLEGAAAHATYAPCSVADLASRGYDYWALGHVHAFEIVNRDPWIVYPGNIQGRSIRETGEKGAVFVDVEDGRVRDVRRILVDQARWLDLPIDVSAAPDRAHVLDAIGAKLRAALRQESGRLVAVRVRFIGVTPLDATLRAGRAALFDEILAIAQHTHEDAWIEKLDLRTTFVKTTAPAHLAGLDLDAMLDSCVSDPELRRRAAEIVKNVAAKLPARVPNENEDDAHDVETLIAEARAIVLARAAEDAEP